MTQFLTSRTGVQVPVSPDDPLPVAFFNADGTPVAPVAASVEDSIGAINTFTDALTLTPGQTASISISGTFVATVVLQRKFGAGAWNNVQKPDGVTGWTAPAEASYDADETVSLRLGIETTYVSGSALCRLGKG